MGSIRREIVQRPVQQAVASAAAANLLAHFAAGVRIFRRE
jgi:hypothetical protein